MVVQVNFYGARGQLNDYHDVVDALKFCLFLLLYYDYINNVL